LKGWNLGGAPAGSLAVAAADQKSRSCAKAEGIDAEAVPDAAGRRTGRPGGAI